MRLHTEAGCAKVFPPPADLSASNRHPLIFCKWYLLEVLETPVVLLVRLDVLGFRNMRAASCALERELLTSLVLSL